MLRRMMWLVIGAGFGFGVSFWVVRTVRQGVARYSPDRVSGDVAGAIRALGSDVRAAVADGRVAMHDRELELRAEIERGR